MSREQSTPWPGMFQAAVRIGVAPEAFWRLSLREWRMLTAVEVGEAPMGRSDFDTLSRLWPDEENAA